MKGSFEFARLICVLLLIFTHTRHNYSEGLAYLILEEVPKVGTLILSLISHPLANHLRNLANIYIFYFNI